MMNCCRAQRALARNLRVAHRTFTTSTTRLAPPEEHDIVVLGGGPAGLALAAALGTPECKALVRPGSTGKLTLTLCTAASSQPISSTHKITLLEASSLDNIASWAPPPEQYSNRVSSITTENVAFLSGTSPLLTFTVHNFADLFLETRLQTSASGLTSTAHAHAE